MTTTDPTLRDAALAHAARGWAVFPVHTPDGGGCSCGDPACRSVGKHPCTANGFHDATTDTSRIATWWTDSPGANIGLAPGEDLAVFDVDQRSGGIESLSHLARRLGPLPATVKALTGGDGEHYLFRVPRGITLPKQIAQGVELRGCGRSFIVVAPSLHASGKHYRWAPFCSPDEQAIVDLPKAWLLEIEKAAGLRSAEILPEEILEGHGRNNYLTSYAGTIRKRGANETEILDAITSVNKVRCRPGLDEKELRGIARSVFRYTPSDPILSRIAAGDAGLVERPVLESDTASWPEPIPFDSPARLPGFPIEALPAPLAHFVAAVAESRQVPLDLPALVALGGVSAAAARRFRVRVTEDYFEPLNLFIAPVLGSGERKSATLRDCTEPLAEFERELQTLSAPAIAAAREQREIEEARLKHLRQQAAKNDDLDLAAQARDLAVRLTQVPAAPRLMVGDVTPEKLASMLVEQDGRIAHVDAEAGIFGTLAGRYSNGRANFEVLLRGHAGDDLRVDRMGRSEIKQHPALTVILTPQPSVLTALADEPQFRGRGLLARFLFALPQSRVGSRRFVNSAVPPGVRAAYRDAIRAILTVEPPEEDEPGHVLRLSATAFAVWRTYYDENELRQREDGDLRGIRDWASKAPGAALRIAGLLHLAAGLREDRPITDETMAAAWAIVRDYLIPHALEAFAVIGTDRNVEQARKIASWIARTQRSRFSRRDVHRNFPGFGEPTDFDAPLRILENRSIIRPVVSEERGPGRKPSPIYDVNSGFLRPSTELTEFGAQAGFVNSVNTPGVFDS